MVSSESADVTREDARMAASVLPAGPLWQSASAQLRTIASPTIASATAMVATFNLRTAEAAASARQREAAADAKAAAMATATAADAAVAHKKRATEGRSGAARIPARASIMKVSTAGQTQTGRTL